MSDSQNVSQCVNLELIKIFVNDVVEERLELNDAGVDFGLFLLKKSIVTGLVGRV